LGFSFVARVRIAILVALGPFINHHPILAGDGPKVGLVSDRKSSSSRVPRPTSGRRNAGDILVA
jgi:hypothetical protein